MSELFDHHRESQTAVPQPAGPVVVLIDEAVSQHLSQVYWDWRAAFDRDPQACPLQHPDYVLAELTSGKVESHLNAVLVRDECQRDQCSIGVLLPKTVQTRQVGGLGPNWALQGLRLAAGRFLGASLSLEQQSRLLNAATHHAAHAGAEFLLIEDLEVATPLHLAVLDVREHQCQLFTTHEFQPRHFVDFPDSEAAYWSTFSSRSLSKFRRNLKKFGTTRLERVTEIDQIPDFLRAAHDISRQSWQSRQYGLRIRNDETELRLLSALAQNGLLRSYLWWINGQPAAFAVCSQNRGCFRYEEIAYRAEFGQFSPGRTMLHQIVEDLLQHDSPECLDFGGGDAEYKQQFANRSSASGTVWLVPPTWRASWSLSYLKTCRAVRAAARTLVEKSGWHTKVRQWIRSGSANTEPNTNQKSGEAAEPSPSSRDRELQQQFTTEDLP
jgi:hypothetical protein